MSKPRKTTFDAWVDQFDNFDLEYQEKGLDMCEFVHRRARRRAGKGKDEEAVEQRAESAQPAPQSTQTSLLPEGGAK